MRIDFVEVANFRKLISTRIGLSPEKTVFVGVNNSGKTSAITALRYFLVDWDRLSFCFNDRPDARQAPHLEGTGSFLRISSR